MNAPKVSIITVCFNSGDSLVNTIESVYSLNYHDYEYIIIDGNSSDDSFNKIEKYKDYFLKKGISYKYISENDSGIYDAMNKGVSLSSGIWINFMNAGDTFHDNNVLHDVFSNDWNEYDIIYGDAICVEPEYSTQSIIRGHPPLPNKMTFCHQATFVKKNILIEYPFDVSLKIAADFDLFSYAYHNNKKFINVYRKIAIFERNGISYKKSHDAFLEASMVREKYGYDEVKSIKVKAIYNYRRVKNYIRDYLPKSIVRIIKRKRSRNKA